MPDNHWTRLNPVTNKPLYDAVVVGSGPNGLAAAIRLAQDGRSVLVLEARETVGGGTRSAELTRPGFVHDVCSAIHPLAVASPYFRQLPLAEHGLDWIQPDLPLAHPLADGTAAVVCQSVSETAEGLDPDEKPYGRLLSPMVAHWETIAAELLQPLLHWPRHPLHLAAFGWRGLQSAAGLARRHFATEPARALFAGMAAHSFLPLEEIPSAAFGLVLGMMAHAVGWPLPRGGAQRIANALAAHLQALGGVIRTGVRVGILTNCLRHGWSCWMSPRDNCSVWRGIG